MPSERRLPLVAALGTAALAGIAGVAAPAPAGATGGLLVAPSSVDARVHPGDALPPIRLVNDTGRDLVVRASTRVATQALSGLPVYALDAAARRRGRAFVAVSPARFVLRAGERRDVRARVRARGPQVGRGAYGVVLFEAVARRGAAQRNAVASRLRLTANLLLTFPSRTHPAKVLGVARSLRAEQAVGGGLRLLVRVHGAGTIHGRPRGRLRIRDAAGRVVARARFATGNVLPGADRELPALVTRRLAAGTYSARATIRSGGRTTSATMALRLVGQGVLPTPDLRIAAVGTPRPEAGERFGTQLVLVNRGTAVAPVRGRWELRSAGGQRLLARGPIAQAPLAAGGRRTATLSLPAVRPGRWRLVVALDAPGRELDRRELVFATGEALGWWPRFQDWAAAHIPLLLTAFAVLLALVAGLALGYTVRLRRRLGARPARPA